MHRRSTHTVLQYRPKPSSWFSLGKVVKTFGPPARVFFIPRSVCLEVACFDSEYRANRRLRRNMQITLSRDVGRHQHEDHA